MRRNLSEPAKLSPFFAPNYRAAGMVASGASRSRPQLRVVDV